MSLEKLYTLSPYCTHFEMKNDFLSSSMPLPILCLVKMLWLIASRALQSAECRKKTKLKSTHSALLAWPEDSWDGSCSFLFAHCPFHADLDHGAMRPEERCLWSLCPLAPPKQHWYNDTRLAWSSLSWLIQKENSPNFNVEKENNVNLSTPFSYLINLLLANSFPLPQTA